MGLTSLGVDGAYLAEPGFYPGTFGLRAQHASHGVPFWEKYQICALMRTGTPRLLQ